MLATLSAAPVRAFHAGAVFDKPAGAGGGGSIFYTGSPRERRWDCSGCHVDAPGRITLELGATPATLLQNFRYMPGQSYAITATLRGEHAGLDSPRANFNGVALAILDGQSAPAGKVSGYSSTDLYAGGPTTLVTAGQKPNVTVWSFTWTAPAAGAGRVTIYSGLVDGNGAGSGAGSTLTDAYGDDVFVGALELDEGSLTARESPTAWAGLAIVIVWCWRKRL